MLKREVEIKTYTHNGVEVTLRLDFRTGLIDIVSQDQSGAFFKKNYLFTGRRFDECTTLWFPVLDAIKYAVTEATKDMSGYYNGLEENAKEVVSGLLDDLIKNKKKLFGKK